MAKQHRPMPNRAHMARARQALERAANPPRHVHKPRPYRGELHRDAGKSLSAQSSWGATASEYMGDGFAVSGSARVSRPNGRMPRP